MHIAPYVHVEMMNQYGHHVLLIRLCNF